MHDYLSVTVLSGTILTNCIAIFRAKSIMKKIKFLQSLSQMPRLAVPNFELRESAMHEQFANV